MAHSSARSTLPHRPRRHPGRARLSLRRSGTSSRTPMSYRTRPGGSSGGLSRAARAVHPTSSTSGPAACRMPSRWRRCAVSRCRGLWRRRMAPARSSGGTNCISGTSSGGSGAHRCTRRRACNDSSAMRWPVRPTDALPRRRLHRVSRAAARAWHDRGVEVTVAYTHYCRMHASLTLSAHHSAPQP